MTKILLCLGLVIAFVLPALAQDGEAVSVTIYKTTIDNCKAMPKVVQIAFPMEDLTERFGPDFVIFNPVRKGKISALRTVEKHPRIENLYGLEMGKKELIIRVSSNGCTHAGSFTFKLDKETP